MTDKDISLLKHLAEKVLGLEEFKPATPFSEQPDGTYYVRYGALIVIDAEGDMYHGNPFGDANDALRMLDMLPIPTGASIQIDRRWEKHENGALTGKKYWDVDVFTDSAKDGNLLRAICLACAKATGWTE